MALNCSFINVGGTSDKCLENFSGIGTAAYIFTADDLVTAGVTVTVDDTKPEYTKDSFDGVALHKINIKSQTGKVTSESTPSAGGFSNVYTGLVASDMETMSFVARVMNNRNDWGMLVPDGNGKMYVIYSPDFDTQFSMSSDTGDTPDSDHGHTVTVTAAPMYYSFMKWDGKVTQAGVGTAATYTAEQNA